MSPALNPIDAGSAFRAGFTAAAKERFAGSPHVLVATTIATESAEDIVLIGGTSGSREGDLGSMGQRTQDWDIALEVSTYAIRYGVDEDATDTEAYDAASGMLSDLAEMVRRDAAGSDTTLGGAVMWCRMENYETTAGRQVAESGVGRLWEFTAVFVARSRTSG